MKQVRLIVIGIMAILVVSIAAFLVSRHHASGTPSPMATKSATCLASTSAKPSSADDSAIQIVVVGQPLSARVPAGTQADVEYNTYSSSQATGSVHYTGHGAYNFVVNQTGKPNLITDNKGNDLARGWQLASISSCK